MTASVPAIELVKVTKRYGETMALDSLSLDIAREEFLVLLGPSGCGKTTVLKVVAGLEDATEGEIYINGRLVNYVAPKARDVAMVFQNYALYPHMTVESNIGFPLKMGGRPKPEVRERVREVTELLELETELKKYPEQLSGGQRQRVALGRAIVRDPVAYLMDEPLSNLDALLRSQMREEILKLHRRVGRTTVYVTHDQLEAMTMADRIVVMRSGLVQQVGSPGEVYGRPANTFVGGFVGNPQMNLFSGLISNGRFDGDGLSIGVNAPAGDATLGIRPENVRLAGATDDGAVPGTIELVEPVGADVFLSVAVGDGLTCRVRTAAGASAREGDRVGLILDPDGIHVFGPDGPRLSG